MAQAADFFVSYASADRASAERSGGSSTLTIPAETGECSCLSVWTRSTRSLSQGW
jgi:hypothetical protein